MSSLAREVVPWLLLALVAFGIRTSFVWSPSWQRPGEQHHIDESFLPLEALGLWEGVTPRELGWPASTTRILLSGLYAVKCVLELPVGELRRQGLGALIDGVGRWIADQYSDRSSLYSIGRWLSALTGTLHVLLCYWAARRWGYRAGAWFAAFSVATAALAVECSQVVLADVTGLVFLAACVGVLGNGTDQKSRSRAVLAGALVGLAAASKFHFGVWIVAVLLWPFVTAPRRSWPARLADATCALAACGLVVVVLVPWVWTSPLVILKEVLATVVAKTGSVSLAHRIGNLTDAIWALGPLVALPALLGLPVLIRNSGARSWPIVLALVLAALSIASLQTMFDRYALLLIPGFVISSAAAVDFAWNKPPKVRIAVLLVILIAASLSGRHLIESQVRLGSRASPVLAREWILTHVSPRARIAVNSLFWEGLPLSPDTLSRTIAAPSAEDAYEEKMATNGIVMASPLEPMRTSVLTDELFHAHWARMELARHSETWYDVTVFEEEPRFFAILTTDALRRFTDGLSDPTAGFDVLVFRGNANLPIQPVLTIRSGSEPLLQIYARPQSPYVTP